MYFPRHSEHDTRWSGNEVTRSLSAGSQAKRRTLLLKSSPDPICGRLRDHREIERATRKRGQTPCGTIHEETRTATLTGENSHHAHRGRLRFLGPERPKVQDGKTM